MTYSQSSVSVLAPTVNAVSVLFIDAGVQDYQQLLASLQPNVQAHVLISQRDGVEQITHILNSEYAHHIVEAIYIVAHGTPGCLYLGNTELSLDNLGYYAEKIKAWSSSELFLYGCNVAAGDAGKEFITKLHNLMGVDIYASTTKVGCTALGGNWELDVAVPPAYGNQSTELPFNPFKWIGVLNLDLDTVTDLGATAANELANQIFGAGVTVNSASYSGGGDQAAIFADGSEASFDNNIISFSSGVIFSTGTAASAGGPNNSDGFTVDATGGIDGDPDFNAAAGGATLDASFLEVNFTPDVLPGTTAGQTGRMTIEIVFGSDEYNEYVYGNVNDTLAVIVNGTNQATVPNGLAIGIDTINDAGNFNPGFGNDSNDPNPDHDSTDGIVESANPSLYVNNDTSDLGATPAANTQMDGYTLKIPVTFDVVLGQANTLKIGIADTADHFLDSWMFIRADSAQTLVIAENDTVSTPTNVPVSIDVTINDYDSDGDILSITAIADKPISLGDTVTLPSGIDVTLELDGTLTVTGDGTNELVDTFTYEVADGNGNTSTAFVNVAMTAPVVNTPPVISSPTGSPATVNFAENGTGTVVDVESSDTEDGVETNLTYSLSGTDASLFSIDPSGNITFDASPDFENPSDAGGNNVYDLTVTATDSGSLTDTQGIQVTVTDVNENPVVDLNSIASVVDISRDTAIAFTEDSGAVNIAAPTADINDFSESDILLLEIAPGGIVDGTSEVMTFNGDGGSRIVLALDGSDVSQQSLTVGGTALFIQYNATSNKVEITEQSGAVIPQADLDALVQGMTYENTSQVPTAGDRTLGISVNDGTSDSNVAVSTITVNAAPDLVNDSLTATEDTQLTGNVFADNGTGADDLGDATATVTAFDANTVNGGTVAINPDGSFTYDPAADFVGTDSFSYTVTDGNGDTDTATVTITVDAAPDLFDDSFTVEEDTQLMGSVFVDNGAGADDLGTATATVTAFDASSVNGGTVVVNPDGTFTYDPAADFNGTDTFTYTVTDADGDTATATVTVMVDANPDAVDDSFDTEEDTQLTGNLFNNNGNGADDLGDSPTTVTAFDATSANGGTVAVNPDGTFTYDPAADFFGTDSFTYTVTDGDGDESTATATIEVNANPDAVADVFNVEEDSFVNNLAVLSNDDIGDAPVTVVNVTSPGNGTVVINPNGTVNYRPSADFNGTDAFTYTIVDADGDVSTAAVTVLVDPNPDAVNDTADVEEDGNIDIDVLVNDEQGNGPAVVTGIFSAPTNGTATINSDGTINYEPNPDFNGNDAFTYTITDADGDTSIATVNIAVNANPDPVNDLANTEEDTPVTINVIGNDDLGDDPATVTVEAGNEPANGTVAVQPDGSIIYTPNADFNGTDTFTYTVTDADGDAKTATVSVDVNANPDLADDSFTVEEDTQLTGSVFSDNGSGVDDLGDLATTVTAFDALSTNGGTVVVNPDGTFSYDPAADFTGTDTFTYTVTDADGDMATATVTVVVDANPDLADDPISTEEDTSVTISVLNNDDPGDLAATVTVEAGDVPANGTATVQPDGSIVYTPNADFNGTDTFTYTVTDADGDVDTAVVVVTVDPNPDLVDDSFNVEEDTQLTGNLFDNNVNGADDLGNPTATVTAFDATSTNGGTVVVNPDGSFTYDPAADFSGADTFTYTVTDADGDIDTATVTIEVNPNPDLVDDSFNVEEDTQLTGALFADNGTGADDLGDTATTVTAFDALSTNGGTVVVNPDGTFSYNPAADFTGTDSFTYTVTDADGDMDTATVTIEVNPNPDLVDDSFNVEEDTQLTGALFADNGTGADDLGDAATTVTAFDALSANGGTVVVNPDGTFSYDPAADFTGTDSFTYTVTDADGDVDTATVTIEVNPNPDLVDDSFDVEEDTQLAGNVFADNGTGADDLGDALATVTGFDATSTNGGTVVMNPDGSFTYDPAADFSGTDTFTYTVTDADGDVDTATVTIEVNANPDLVDDSFNVEEDTQLTGALFADNGTGADDLGDAATTVTAFDALSTNGGTVVVNPDGTFSYDPAADFTGTDSFTYTVTDADGDVDTATVTIEVNPNPDLVDDSFNVEEDTQLTGALFADNGTGADDLGDAVTTVTAFDALSANGGTVNVNPDGTFSYDPAADFTGTDSFTYTVTDADGDMDTATVTIEVNPNPDLVDDSFNAEEDTQLTGTLFADNGTGADDLGDTATTVTAFDSTSVNGGTVVVNSDGTFSYDPAADFNGTDSFTYTVTDADGDMDTATVTIEVNPNPDLVDDNFNVEEDTQLAGNVFADNGSGADDLGDALATVTAFDAVSANGGTVAVNPDGSFTYDPAADFNGTDTFTYTVTDADGDVDPATVTVEVNANPDLVDDSFNVEEDTQLAGSLFGDNGNGADDLGDTLTTVTSFDAVSVNGGTVVVKPDGTFTYDPAADFFGTDTFTYTVTDADGDMATATATVIVDPNPDLVDDAINTEEDNSVAIDVLNNDDLGNDPATVTVSSGSNGTVTVQPNGSVVYTPNADFNGVDNFTYTVTDADGDSDSATVTVTVDSNPDLVDDSLATEEDTQLTGSVFADNGTGADDLGDALATVTAFDAVSANGGTVVVNSDGSFTYDPAADFFGTDTFTYTVTDADGDVDTATVTVEVNANPDLVDDSFNVEEDTQLAGSVFADNGNGADDLGDTAATVTGFDAVSANGGTVAVNPDGTFTYDPAADFFGTDSFTYTVTDADGDTSTATVTIEVDANPDPVADLVTTEEDTPVTIDVLGNDDLGDSPATVTVEPGDVPANGTVTVNPDGSVLYMPDADFNGTDTFTYTLTDADGDVSTETVMVEVNANPDLMDDSFATEEDTQLAGSVFADNGNGADDLGDALATVTGFDAVSANGGTVVVKPDGTFTYDPAADFFGTDTFTYTVTDADGDTSTATVTIEVDANPDPVADLVATEEDMPVTIAVLTNDDLGDGPATVTVEPGGEPANGSVSVNPDGSVVYTPDADFNGTDTFTYTLTDADGDISTETVTVEVNANPDLMDDSFATEEDTQLTGSVFADNGNGADDLGDPTATVTSFDGTSVNGGTVVVNPDGTFSYDPAADFNGPDSFTYTVTDADGDTSTATVSVEVNANPDLVDDSFAVEEDTQLTGNVFADNGNGPDDLGDAPATVTGFDAVSANGGTVVVNPDGTFSYDPAADFNGSDSFTYTVTDADGDISTATVTIEVNAGPDAVADLVVVEEDTPITIDVLTNDDIGDGPAIVTVEPGNEPANGTVAVQPDGSVVYTPNADFNGPDSFTYTVTDADGDISTATVSVEVNANPDLMDDSFAAEEDTQLTGNVFSDNGNGVDDLGDAPATVTGFDAVSANGGTVVVNPDGTFSYDPAADFNGTDSFTYTVTDADGDTATATVMVEVNAGPDAIADLVATEEDTPITIDVLTNDDIGDGPATVTVEPGNEPTNGTVTVNPDGSVVYTPNADFSGSDSFTYTLTDADGDISTETVTVEVNANPDLVDDSFAAEEDTQLTGNVFADNGNGADDLGDAPATVTDFDGTSANGGTVVVNPDGTFSYDPTADFFGTDNFTYTVTDADGDISTATVTIEVNAGPDAIADLVASEEDSPVTIDVLTNDDLGDGPVTVTVEPGNEPANGTVTVNPDGSVVYTPDADFNGPDSFTYTVTDADGDTSTAVVNVDVNANPDLVDDTFATEEDTSLTGNVFADNGNGADDLGDSPATVTDFDALSANGGTVVVNPDGTFTYEPVADFNGADTFTYTVTDADGDISTATVTVEVNANPDAVNDAFTVKEDSFGTSLDVLANDDLGDVPATVINVTTPGNGAIAINPDGTLNYQPNADFTGIDAFTYTVRDADGDVSTAGVTITIDPAPDAVNDTVTVEEDGSIDIDVVINDDQGSGPATVTGILSAASNGNATINPDGTINYQPNADFTGTDAFTYTITDANGDTSNATVNVTVDANPDPVGDLASTEEDTPVTINVLNNDDIGDGPATVTVEAGNEPANGSVSINPDGSVVYTPDADFNGIDSFTYTVTDADGDIATETVTVDVNANPDAAKDSFAVEEDTQLTGNVFSDNGNGADDLGDLPTTVTGFDAVSANGGTVAVSPDGTFSYDPAADFFGIDTFTYTVTDADGDSSTATVTIEVDANPDAIADTVLTEEDTPITIDVLNNDDIGDGPATVTVEPGNEPANGAVTVNPDGSVVYTPDADFNGTDSFTYTVTDADGDVATETVTVEVNANPDLVDDSFAAEEDTQLTGNVFADNGNGADDLGDAPATVTGFDAVSANGGTVVVNPDGTFSYDPDADFNGTDTFTYTVTDADGDISTATVTVEVNAGPDAVADLVATEEDMPVTIDVLGNDDIGDGPATVTVEPGDEPTNGTVTVNPDGSVVYTPNADFNGSDSFTYTVTDADGDVSTETVTVEVNANPDLVDDSFAAEEDTQLTGNVFADNGNGADDLGDAPATVTGFDAVSANGGTVVVNPDGTFSYDPATDFNGTDSFTYTVTDADGDQATATVTIEVDAGPDAIADLVATEEDTPVTIDVLANDDIGDGPATVTVEPGNEPANGAVTVNPDGSVVYTPDADFNGSDSFTYTVTDADGDISTETVTVEVNANPDLVDDSFAAEEDTQLTGNVFADNGNGADDLGDAPATVTDFDAVSANGGTVVVNPDGTFSYDPAVDFNGTDSFTYTVTDADGDTATATVTIEVDAGPDAIADTVATEEDSPVTIDVLGNDDLGDGPATVTVEPGHEPDNGSVTVNPDGSVVYTPDADFNGPDSFTYTVTDADGDISTATVSVEVNANPDLVDDSFAAEEDTQLTGNVFADNGNGADDLGDAPATVTGFDAVSANGGTVVVNPDGTFTYDPAADFNGTDTFTYTVTDADGDQATATVTIEVDAGPDAIADTANTHEDTPVTIDVLGNDDLGNGPATVTIAPGNEPANGTVVAQPDGSVVYTPNADFNGPDSFTYTVTDADGDTSTETVSIEVNATPDLVDDSFAAEEDTLLTGNVFENNGNGVDDLGDAPATVTAFDATSVNGGTVNVNPDGTFTYDPAADFNGTDSFTYTVTDADGDQATATVTLDVNAAPDSVADTVTTGEDIPVTINVLTNDDIGDGPATVTVEPGDEPANGTVTVNPDGSVVYTPNADFSGSDVLTYTVTDADGDTSSATVTVDVIEDLDDDNDGILDIDEGTGDLDGDGIANYLDLDSDGDGISDLQESGLSPTDIATLDTDNDGVIDPTNSFGDNGLADAVEVTPDSGSIDYTGNGEPIDTDGDNVADFKDLDSDNDGINDVIESGGTDADGNGIEDNTGGTDTDGDGIPNALDPDNGGSQSPISDTDGDGAFDFRDLDSDNDGITDVIEGGNQDSNNDGLVDGPDSDGDGIADSVDPADGFGDSGSGNAPDQDGDLTPNYLDLDSDNDGLNDVIEGGNGSLDRNGDGVVDGVDTDGDGIIDAVDPTDGFGNTGANAAPDTDGNGTPDFLQPGSSTTGGQGSGGNDVITGDDGDNIINGLSDNDTLDGGGGNDIVNGGSDLDVMLGGTGNDVLNGGSSGDNIEAGAGDDIINSGSGDDVAYGQAGVDIINGGSGNDTLYGGLGNDLLTGGSDDDLLFGGAGRDVLRGGSGNDVLTGGDGNDFLSGGQGSDIFAYTQVSEFGDVIQDFEIVRDRIDLSAITNGNASLGSNVTAQQAGNHTALLADTGSGDEQVALLLNVNANTLDNSNFIF